MKTTVGATRLEVANGDLLTLPADAIVGIATTDLTMDHGEMAVIRAAAGEIVEHEAVAQGPIEVGDAVATTAGTLQAKWLVHAAVLGGRAADANLVAQVMRRTLEVSDRLRVRSVAVPLLAVADSLVDDYACAGIMVATARRYLTERPHSGLRRVLFSAPDPTTRAAFKNAIAGSTRV